MNKQNRNRLINTENTLVVAIEEEGEKGVKYMKGIKRYILPIIK